MRQLYGRIPINMGAVAERESYERQRKLDYYKRMKAMGVRGTSITKYLRRGFPGPFVIALRQEMVQLIEDLKRRWW